MWVTHARRLAVGVTFAVGAHGELLTAADAIVMTPFLDFTPVSDWRARSYRTEVTATQAASMINQRR